MHLTIVDVRVKPDRVNDFIAAIRLNHEGAVKEAGNIRFDILQSPDDPTRFVFYELYATADAAARHKESPHYLKWRDSVAEWMAEPRRGARWNVLFPSGG